MANFIATTVSNGPRLRDPVGARAVLARYHWEGDLNITVSNEGHDDKAFLNIYGYEWPTCWRIPDGIDPEDFDPYADDDNEEDFDGFLRDIAPFLAEPLTVQAVGAEKCRFPLAAHEWHVKLIGTNGFTIEETGFNHHD